MKEKCYDCGEYYDRPKQGWFSTHTVNCGTCDTCNDFYEAVSARKRENAQLEFVKVRTKFFAEEEKRLYRVVRSSKVRGN